MPKTKKNWLSLPVAVYSIIDQSKTMASNFRQISPILLFIGRYMFYFKTFSFSVLAMFQIMFHQQNKLKKNSEYMADQDTPFYKDSKKVIIISVIILLMIISAVLYIKWDAVTGFFKSESKNSA